MSESSLLGDTWPKAERIELPDGPQRHSGFGYPWEGADDSPEQHKRELEEAVAMSENLAAQTSAVARSHELYRKGYEAADALLKAMEADWVGPPDGGRSVQIARAKFKEARKKIEAAQGK